MAIDAIRRFRRQGGNRRGEAVSIQAAATEAPPPAPVARECRILRLFISSPSYALAERRQIDTVLARLNAALAPAFQIAAIDRDTAQTADPAKPSFTAADCDGVIAVMRPRLASDAPQSEAASPSEPKGGVAGVLTAMKGRDAGLALPDIFIFRFSDRPGDASDPDWESGKQAFDAWFKAKGGQFLAFEDFSNPADLGARLEGQLRAWAARQSPAARIDEIASLIAEIALSQPAETPLEVTAAPPAPAAAEMAISDAAPEELAPAPLALEATATSAPESVALAAEAEPAIEETAIADAAEPSPKTESVLSPVEPPAALVAAEDQPSEPAETASDIWAASDASAPTPIPSAPIDLEQPAIAAFEPAGEAEGAEPARDETAIADEAEALPPADAISGPDEPPGPVFVEPTPSEPVAEAVGAEPARDETAIADEAEALPPADAISGPDEPPGPVFVEPTPSEPVAEAEGAELARDETAPAEEAEALPPTDAISLSVDPVDLLAPKTDGATAAEVVAEPEPLVAPPPVDFFHPGLDAADREPVTDVAITAEAAEPVADETELAKAHETALSELAAWDAKYRALEAESNNKSALIIRLEQSAQARASRAGIWRGRIAWTIAIGLIASLGGALALVENKSRSAATGQGRAEPGLAAAAVDQASALAFDLTQTINRRANPTESEKATVERARALAGLLAKAGGYDPAANRGAIDALLSSVDGLAGQGKVAEALGAAAHAQQMLQMALIVEPDAPGWLMRSAAAYSKVGEIYVGQKNTDEALNAFRQAIAIDRARLLKEPANREVQTALAAAQFNIGDLLVGRGRLDDALVAYREAQGLRKAIGEAGPDNPEAQRGLLEVDNAIGDLLTAQNQLDDALASYHDALTIAEKMAPLKPGEPKWLRAVTLGNNKIGDVLLAKSRFDDALASYRDGLTVASGLAEKDPSSSEWQSLKATCHERIGDALSAEGHQDSALAAYQNGLTIVTALAGKDPENADWQKGISETQLRIGWVLFNQGNTDASIKAHRQSLAVVKAMVAKNPEDAKWQRDLMLDDGKIAQLLMAQGKHAEALPIYQEALAIAKTMGAKEPSNPEWQGTRGVVDSNVGRLLMEAGNREAALVAYRDARTVSEALVLKDPGNVDWQTGLVIAYYNLAEAGEDKGTNLLRAVDILKRLDSSGMLPADKRELIPKIDAELLSLNGKAKRR